MAERQSIKESVQNALAVAVCNRFEPCGPTAKKLAADFKHERIEAQTLHTGG